MEEIIIVIEGGLYFACYSNKKIQVTVVDLDYLTPEDIQQNIKTETSILLTCSKEVAVEKLTKSEEL